MDTSPPQRRRRAAFGAVAAVLAVTAAVGVWLIAVRPSGPPAYAGPALFPAPQHISGAGTNVDLSGRVTLVAEPDTDPAALASLTALLGEVAREVVTASSADSAGRDGAVVYLGTQHDGGSVKAALRKVGAAAEDGTRAAALGRPEGYVLATGSLSGRPTAVLAGADARGTFYAVQSLRQLLADGRLTAVSVSDWPLMRSRGVIEGFYGFPWSPQGRTAVVEAMGRAKMNTYMYSPKDDPLAREKWRDPYPEGGLDELRALVATAGSNHIEVSYALSPGLDICYAATSDLDAAVEKLESLYAIGVRSFVIPLDDIGGSFTCRADRERFTARGQAALAQAQASFLNALRDRLEAAHSDLAPLQMVPTNYSGSGRDPYKTQLGLDLDPRIIVQWTGDEVVSHRITEASAVAARKAYGTKVSPRTILVWDNVPVNDFSPDRLFLSPVEGRDPALYQHVLGMVANPMIQPYASLPGIATFADMTWNGPAYRPNESLDAALRDLAGTDPAALAALRAFTDLNQNWQLDDLPHPAPALSRDVDAFWAAYRAGTPAPAGLGERARLLERLPELLPRLREPGYAEDVAAWSTAASHYGTAIRRALDMLSATQDGDAAAARESRDALLGARSTALVPAQRTLDGGTVVPVTGDGVVQDFLADALGEYDQAFGA